ncbi:MAG: DUF3575 domain-containing protein [Spirochaetota bacterium]
MNKTNIICLLLLLLTIINKTYATEEEYDLTKTLTTIGSGYGEYSDGNIKYAIPVFLSYQKKEFPRISSDVEFIIWFIEKDNRLSISNHFYQISGGIRYWFINPFRNLYMGIGLSGYYLIEQNKNTGTDEEELSFGTYIKAGYAAAVSSHFGFDFGLKYDVKTFEKISSLNSPCFFMQE